MKRSTLAIGLGAIALLFAASGNASEPGEAGDASAIFFADPQIHNVYGEGIKQTWVVSDLASKVAQRPPELNLLAPYVLAELLSRANALTGRDRPLPMIALGDTTNVACESELDRFGNSVRDVMLPGQLLFIAHGNHDSYLMGTVNSYAPTNLDAAMAAWNAEGSPWPVDESWWPEGRIGGGASWRGICRHPDGGRPLNKGQWLARYAASLQPAGFSWRPAEADAEGLRLVAGVAEGSALAALDYVALGRWYPPRKDHRFTGGWDLQRVWKSYLVQAFDLGDSHRVILFDSSVCEDARGGLKFKESNAGTHACIGEEQLADIRALAATDRRLVIGAHYPFEGFTPRERDDLVAAITQRRPDWTYVSAHTHSPRAPEQHGRGWELNIGSTTDWPMEASLLTFSAASAAIGVAKVRLEERPPVRYADPPGYQGSELCRHVQAAESLARMSRDNFPARWKSPGSVWSFARCRASDRAPVVARLAAAEATIAQRMASDPWFRRRAFEIAAAASQREWRSIDGADLLGAAMLAW